MVSRLNPHLYFNGQARQAMEFYQQVFGGELALISYAESGMPPGPDAEKIMHSMLENDQGFTLMAADCPPGEEIKNGNDFSVSVSGDDVEDLRGYWEKLAAEGTVVVPMEKQMWGDEFGMCHDKFGVSWMVNISET